MKSFKASRLSGASAFKGAKEGQLQYFCLGPCKALTPASPDKQEHENRTTEFLGCLRSGPCCAVHSCGSQNEARSGSTAGDFRARGALSADGRLGGRPI